MTDVEDIAVHVTFKGLSYNAHQFTKFRITCRFLAIRCIRCRVLAPTKVSTASKISTSKCLLHAEKNNKVSLCCMLLTPDAANHLIMTKKNLIVVSPRQPEAALLQITILVSSSVSRNTEVHKSSADPACTDEVPQHKLKYPHLLGLISMGRSPQHQMSRQVRWETWAVEGSESNDTAYPHGGPDQIASA